TVGEIVGALEGKAPVPELLSALITLERQGDLVEGAAPLSPEIAAFWEAQGVNAAHAAERLGARTGELHGESATAGQACATALAQSGVTVARDAPIHVIVVDDYLDGALAELNRRALAEGFFWVPVKPGGLAAWVGPVFTPGIGPCWACLAH